MEERCEDEGWVGGKAALVTGASSGLGREFALALAAHGCHVVIAARRLELLQSLHHHINSLHSSSLSLSSASASLPPSSVGSCERIADAAARKVTPGKAAVVRLDVSGNEASVDASVQQAWDAFGKIDILVNNAGFRGSVKSPLDLDEDEWNTAMATNLRGVWLVSKSVGKRMRAAKQGGSIINISSIAGLERSLVPGAIAYASSKAAVNQLTKIMALELGKFNIRVNAVAAGIFRSEITSELMEKKWMSTVAKKIVPLRRWGNTDPDLTSLILLLASDLSSYITGNIFIVDGGQSIAGIPIWSSL